MNNPKTIIICDDDEGILDVASIVLKEKGYQIVSIRESLDVLPKVHQIQPDIILLDLWMPDIGGDELTRRLKASSETNHIPVVIVSANKDTEKISKQIGADDFLCKPFDIADLEEIVEKHSSS